MRVRYADRGDIPELIRLLFQVNDVHAKIRPDLFRAGGRKYTPEALEKLLEDPDRPILVAAEEERLLGYAMCELEYHAGETSRQDMKVLYLDDLCVDEKSRRSGAGKLLFQAVRDYARSLGCYEITLNVWQGNDAARAFYEAMGMTVQKTGMELIL